MMRVALVAVGDELLLGSLVDTNTAWLAGRLAEAGLDVVGAAVVGDEVAALVDAVEHGLGRADVVVVAGGLGPTPDDRTRAALAAWSRRPLRRRADLEATLRGWYAGRGGTLPAAALRQADLPEGAVALPNPTGSAAGVLLDTAAGTVVALPGVPSELRAMVEATVLPWLVDRAGGPAAVVTRQLRCVLLGESVVAERLAPLEAALPADVRLAYLAEPGEVRVRLTTAAATRQEAQAALDPWVARARALVGDAMYGEGEGGLDAAVHALLLSRGATVAAAESLTGGLLGAALSEQPGASATFRGSVVAYATDLKAGLLGVDAGLLGREGAVHPDVALQMARGVRRALGATWGVATTGVAGPDRQDGRPVGTVHVAVCGPGPEEVASPLLGGDRARVRRLSVLVALDLLRRRLQLVES